MAALLRPDLPADRNLPGALRHEIRDEPVDARRRHQQGERSEGGQPCGRALRRARLGRASVLAQGDHRIDGRGARRRHEAGDQRGGEQHERHPDERRRREGADAEDDVAERAHHEPGASRAEDRAGERRQQPLAQYLPQHAAPAGPERHAQPDLVRPLRHGKRHHAVDPERRQDQRDRGEAREQRGRESIADERLRDDLIHRPDVAHRQVRVEALDDRGIAWPSFSLYRGGAYALGPEVNNAASRIYAVEGSCFVIAPCATVSKEMVAMLCGDDPMKKQLLLEGGGFTTIYAPDGQLMHEPLAEGTEGIVYADLDLGMISLAKAAADPAGHYARPDVTRLLLDRTPGDRVVIRKRQGAERGAGERRRAGGRALGRGHRAAASGGVRPEERRMDSAIPSHLRCPRSRQRRVPDDYVPPYPSFVARHAQRVERVVMAYFGAQSQDRDRAALEEAVQQLARRFAGRTRAGPLGSLALHRRGRVRERRSARPTGTTRRATTPGSRRRAATGRGVARPGLGTFTEVLRPHVERYETLFSAPDRAEGIAVLADGDERHGDGACLLGRRARPHPGLADRRDGAARRAGARARRRAASRCAATSTSA